MHSSIAACMHGLAKTELNTVNRSKHLLAGSAAVMIQGQFEAHTLQLPPIDQGLIKDSSQAPLSTGDQI